MIAQLAASLPRWREIPEGFYQLICKAFYGGADPLVKGAGHKYVRRVPTGKTTKTGRPVYRYHYRVTGGHGLAHHNEIVEGAAFQITHNGQKGHFHVEKVDGDKVTVRHDESGHTQEMTKQELREALHEHHADEVHEARARARRDHEKAQIHGTEKQKRRAREHLERTERALGNPGADLRAKTAEGRKLDKESGWDRAVPELVYLRDKMAAGEDVDLGGLGGRKPSTWRATFYALPRDLRSRLLGEIHEEADRIKTEERAFKEADEERQMKADEERERKKAKKPKAPAAPGWSTAGAEDARKRAYQLGSAANAARLKADDLASGAFDALDRGDMAPAQSAAVEVLKLEAQAAAHFAEIEPLADEVARISADLKSEALKAGKTEAQAAAVAYKFEKEIGHRIEAARAAIEALEETAAELERENKAEGVAPAPGAAEASRQRSKRAEDRKRKDAERVAARKKARAEQKAKKAAPALGANLTSAQIAALTPAQRSAYFKQKAEEQKAKREKAQRERTAEWKAIREDQRRNAEELRAERERKGAEFAAALKERNAKREAESEARRQASNDEAKARVMAIKRRRDTPLREFPKDQRPDPARVKAVKDALAPLGDTTRAVRMAYDNLPDADKTRGDNDVVAASARSLESGLKNFAKVESAIRRGTWSAHTSRLNITAQLRWINRALEQGHFAPMDGSSAKIKAVNEKLERLRSRLDTLKQAFQGLQIETPTVDPVTSKG